VKLSKISFIIAIVFALSIGLSACGTVDGSSVATVNGLKITKSEFNFYLAQVKAQVLDKAKVEDTPEFWATTDLEGKKAIDSAIEKALEEAEKAAIITQKAKENGIKLSQEDITNIGKQKSSQMQKSGGRDAFEAELKKNGLTDETYTSMLENSLYTNKLIEKLTTAVDDATAKQYYLDKTVRVKHVLFMTVDQQSGKALPKEQLDAAKAKADQILAKAKAGEDFDKLVAEFSEDPGSKSQPDGYILGKGFALGSQGGMVPAFETASLALQVGAVSDIVETNYGYHIIKRYPTDESQFEKNKEEIKTHAKNSQFEDMQAQWKTEAKIVVNEKELKSFK